MARANAKPVQPKRLGSIGPDFLPAASYACALSESHLNSAEPCAQIPFVVETWAVPAESATRLSVCVNRTPITGAIEVARDKRDIDLFGCGLSHTVAQAPHEKHFTLWLNIITPFMPITSDDKAPDLKPFLNEICSAVGKAVKKAHRPNAKGGSQKDIALEHLDTVIADVSGNGRYRFGQRQLLYGLRPISPANVCARFGQRRRAPAPLRSSSARACVSPSPVRWKRPAR